MKVFVLLWLLVADSGAVPSSSWLRELVARYEEPYWEAHRALLQAVARQNGLDVRLEPVRRRLVIAHLLHQFVAAHRRSWGGSLLGVRYVYMDERAQILHRIETPEGPVYEPLYSRHRIGHRYVQRAHVVDRVPRIFLQDLFSEFPRYRWEGTALYSFGWCSELEMAYVTLLDYFGIPARIVMPRATHVRTQVWITPQRAIVVDNTEGWFARQPWPYAEDAAPHVPPQARRYLAWYQARAREGAVVPVGPRARARVEEALREYLRQRRSWWAVGRWQERLDLAGSGFRIGALAGGVALLALWGLIWFYYHRYRRRMESLQGGDAWSA